MRTGVQIIARERKRQIAEEGRTAKHDDKHKHMELANAAACYAAGERLEVVRGFLRDMPGDPYPDRQRVVKLWPWAKKWWKPTLDDRVRDLAKAGALIAAEIDRLNRIS